MGLIDFHSHILPEADHGSDSLETSVGQLKLLSSAGIDRVVATPHFYPQRISVEGFLSLREECAELLSSAENEGFPTVYLGAEVLVCPGLDHMPGLEKLCIKGTNVLLLEMPFFKWREEFYETVVRISEMDFQVVMAHIGRYPSHSALRLVDEADVRIQLNGEDTESHHGRKKAKMWLDTGLVSAIGSDMHGADKTYMKNYGKMAELAGEGVQKKTASLLEGAVPLRFKEKQI